MILREQGIRLRVLMEEELWELPVALWEAERLELEGEKLANFLNERGYDAEVIK